MVYSGAIADTLREIFSDSGILATFEDKNGIGVFTVRLKLRCRMQSAHMVVLVREEDFSTLTTLPLCADENHRLAMAEFIARVNWGMRNGNFELNMLDGEIRFKTHVHTGKQPPDMGAARLATMLPFLMIDRFGDAIIDVLFGFKSPREAFESVQTNK
ncbi:MAG: hypothetical protein IKU38_05280 [Clostridia bacterium]|nr:hypothetical protein [Clostridia bacterium]